jgi:hypothetical protein
MIHERFNEVVDIVVGKVKDLLQSKNVEYARGGDKLHNFKKAAGFGGTQETALGGMMLKHTVSIYDMIDDVAKANNASIEKWEEKIVDHINYLILLYAMQVERDDMFKDLTEFKMGPILGEISLSGAGAAKFDPNWGPNQKSLMDCQNNTGCQCIGCQYSNNDIHM